MKLFLIILLIVNVFVILQSYRVLRRKGTSFRGHNMMTSPMMLSGIFSLALSMLLQFLFLDHEESIMIFSLLTGIFIGKLFGMISSFQTVLSGIFNGIMGSFTGIMTATSIKNPSLCGLSNDSLLLLVPDIMKLSVFTTAVMLLILLFIQNTKDRL